MKWAGVPLIDKERKENDESARRTSGRRKIQAFLGTDRAEESY